MICRPIPENSVLEIVAAWSTRRRGIPLVVLGTFDAADPYHACVLDAAGDEVRFLGAIYDPETVSALRFHGRVYLHGHTVGGTNPSLVEAMAAGNAVIAQDNGYNRFVAGEGNRYFTDAGDLAGLSTSSSTTVQRCAAWASPAASATRPSTPGNTSATSTNRRSCAAAGSRKDLTMIKVAVVGLGKMGLSHLSMVRAHPDVDLVGVCDSTGYLLDVLSKYTGVSTFGDLDEMLDDRASRTPS